MPSSRHSNAQLLRRCAAGALAVATLTAGACASATAAPGDIPGRGFLPENRGWERVSPADKNDGDVMGTYSTQSATSGDAVVLASHAAFANPSGGGAITQYLARRGADGWSVKALTPSLGPDVVGANPSYYPGFQGFSEDLARGVFRSGLGDPLLAAGASNDVRNLYRVGTADDAYDLMTPPPGPMPDPLTSAFYAPRFAEASKDFSRVAIESSQPLTSDAPTGVPNNVFVWDDGGLELASVLPNGTPAPNGASVGLGAGSVNSGFLSERTMSDDGRRIVFTSPVNETSSMNHPLGGTAAGPPRLYVRDGEATVEASESQRTPPDPDGPYPVGYEAASEDGSRVFFRSCEKLTDDSTAFAQSLDVGQGRCPFGPGSTGLDLYMFDVTSGELTDLTVTDPQGANVLGVLGASADGSYVYFVAGGLLDGGQGTPDAANLYVWHEGEVRYVSTLIDGASALDGSDYQNWAPENFFQRSAQLSADGSRLLYTSYANQTAFDADGHRQAYLYDYAQDAVRCVSCPLDGRPVEGDVELRDDRRFEWFFALSQRTPRTMNEAGDRVVFSTADALVPEDVNEAADVYLRTGNVLSLLSDGSGPYGAGVVDMSADGDDVFMVTRNRLVAADDDNLKDLYDARVGGGFPEPPAVGASCEGDACQGHAPGVAADRTAPGSSQLRGAGDSSSRNRPSFGLLTPSRAQRARLARGRAATFRIKVNGAGRVVVVVRAKMGRRSAVVARGTARARRATTVKMRLRISSAGRRQMIARGVLRTTVSVAFRGKTNTGAMTLRRAGGKR